MDFFEFNLGKQEEFYEIYEWLRKKHKFFILNIIYYKFFSLKRGRSSWELLENK